MRIPERGASREPVRSRLERFRAEDMPWRDGRTGADVYDPGREAEAVIKQAYASYPTENALDPTVFPSALRMENEVVAMAASRLVRVPEAGHRVPYEQPDAVIRAIG